MQESMEAAGKPWARGIRAFGPAGGRAMRTEDFDYKLPRELIAQRPAERRDRSRLLVVDRRRGKLEHAIFSDLPRFLKAGDVVILNDTRVIKCRLFGVDAERGRPVELLLVRELEGGCWEALARPGKRARPGARISLCGGAAQAEVVEHRPNGRRLVRISSDRPVADLMRNMGHVPLPPYIKRPDEAEDEARYQTVYARHDGAVAAPTAGLHFSEELLWELEEKGVRTARVTLHVGPGTFKPVRTSDPAQHRLEAEWFRFGADQAAVVNEARRGGRAVCVGTTVARVMETVARPGGTVDGEVEMGGAAGVDGDGTDRAGAYETSGAHGRAAWIAAPGEGWTDKFILPPYEFKMVDCLVTNFHLPKTTLLMLVSALAGRELILKAYEEAVAEKYRFYSYGDAMLIL